MRAIFGVLALVLVVAIVGVLVKKQLAGGTASGPRDAAGASTPAGPPTQQAQQFEQAVQGAMQQARPMPDNDK